MGHEKEHKVKAFEGCFDFPLSRYMRIHEDGCIDGCIGSRCAGLVCAVSACEGLGCVGFRSACQFALQTEELTVFGGKRKIITFALCFEFMVSSHGFHTYNQIDTLDHN